MSDAVMRPADARDDAAFRLRQKALNSQQVSDRIFRNITFLSALAVLLILGGVIFSLLHGSLPVFQAMGFDFLTSQRWNPVTEKFGALPAIYGTLITALIAIVIAVPVGLGIAVFLTELCPPSLRRPIGVTIELLAGIPSIIYGMWGFFVLAPFMQSYIQPAIIALFGYIPVLNTLFEGPPLGIGLFTSGLILAIMILPFITAISRDVFETVPPVLKEAAYGIGCTTWEMVRKVMLPYTRIGIVGGVMLGLGRALGETMAVTFVVGNVHKIPSSLLAPGTTISAAIANEFAEAEGVLHTSALMALGQLLFVITFIVLALSRLMLMRLEKQGGK